jgi:hypothetical protein
MTQNTFRLPAVYHMTASPLSTNAKKITRTATVLLLLAATSAAAGAADHQICYQGYPSSSTDLYALFGCRSDDPSVTCSIGLQGGTWVSSPAGLLRKVPLPQTGTYTTNMTFSDGTVRPCTFDVIDPSLITSGTPYGWPLPSGATLFGYTTDASGRLMTAVWTHHSNTNEDQVLQSMSVPGDMVAVGGGVTGVESPHGALVTKSISNLDAQKREWAVETSDLLSEQLHDNDAYIIGLKIEGLDPVTLRSLISDVERTSITAPHPSAAVSKSTGTIALGGGVYGFDPTTKNQYATASYPTIVRNVCVGACEFPYTVTGWASMSKDHIVSAPGVVSAYLRTITSDITIAGAPFHVVGSVAWATSAVAEHPSVVVAGAPGGFALTGIGAYVDWQDYGWAGNLIWKLQPRPDIAGAEVASKDYAYYSPSTITGYALGIKLVPGPTPTPRQVP